MDEKIKGLDTFFEAITFLNICITKIDCTIICKLSLDLTQIHLNVLKICIFIQGH